MLARCVGCAAIALALLGCRSEAEVVILCPTEPGERVQVWEVQRVEYAIRGDCPAPDDCKPSHEWWTYETAFPDEGGGDIRFVKEGYISHSVAIGYEPTDPFCCPTRGVDVYGVARGTVRLRVEVRMAVDDVVHSYTDVCELPVVTLDLVPLPTP